MEVLLSNLSKIKWIPAELFSFLKGHNLNIHGPWWLKQKFIHITLGKKKIIKDALIKLVSLILWIYNNFIFYHIINFQIMTHIPKK